MGQSNKGRHASGPLLMSMAVAKRSGGVVRGATGRLSRLDMRVSPYLYVAPFFLLFGAFGLYPLVMTGYMSFTDWNLIGAHHFVGLDNYAALLKDEHFWNAVRN